MHAQSVLRRSLRALDNWRCTPIPAIAPQEGEVWKTRDDQHQVLVVTRDPLRPDHQYPISGIVISPDNGGDFKHKQNIIYPRFTLAGCFVFDGREHPLDLISRIA